MSGLIHRGATARTRRAATLTLLTTLLAAVTATNASAAGTDFTMTPTSGPVGTTVTLDAANTTDFAPDGTTTAAAVPAVAFNGVASTTVSQVSATELTAVVPTTATTGPVTVTVGSTTYTGPDFTVSVAVTPQQPSWTATLSPATVRYGDRVTVTGILTSAGSTDSAIAGVAAQLQTRTAGGSGWADATGTQPQQTNAAGTVHWSVVPKQSTQYRVTSDATTAYLAAASPAVSAQVRPILTLQPLAVTAVGVTTHIVGSVRPAVAGTVHLQLLTGSTWRGVAHVGTDNGRFSFAITATSEALLHYRVVEAANHLHTAGTSPTLRVEVARDQLRYGDSGADVRALQSQLRQLHYDVGAPSSSYGWNLVHAVTAFEKVQGISRDGAAGPAVWRALGNPKSPHLQHPYPNKPVAVEINLTKQILMIAKYGRIWRILDTSTGGGYTFTGTGGEQDVAITPTGHFTIRYKVDHLVTDSLGSLWRPSYFDDSGDAIHGEGDGDGATEVPPYAASHGCVRITDLAANRYYDLLAVGTPVWIYH